MFNYSIDNEEFSIEGNEKEEKGIQTKTINLKLQKDYFSIEKEYLNKSLEKDNNLILKKLKPTILSKIKKSESPEIKEKNKTKEVKDNSLLNKILINENEINDKLIIDSIETISQSTQTYNNSIFRINHQKLFFNPNNKKQYINNLKQNDLVPSSKVVNFNILGNLHNDEESFTNEMIQTEEKVYKNNDIKKEDFSFEILKELKDKIFKIYYNNEFTFEILKEQKEKEEIKNLNKNKYNNKPLEISNNLKIELLKNNNQLKSENNILEIYQNKDFTFKILNKEENKKKRIKFKYYKHIFFFNRKYFYSS